MDQINLAGCCNDRIVVKVTGRYDPIIRVPGIKGFNIVAQNARTIINNVSIIGTPPPAFATNTPTRTLTPVPTATRTPTITRTPTRTNTPTNTPTSTRTPTKTPTGSPSWTPTKTPTVTLTPTPTPVFTNTPTPTATPACLIGAGAITFGANHFSWTLTNLTNDPVLLTDLILTWPTGIPEAKLNSISADPNIIWSGNELPPTIQVCETCPKVFSGVASDRQINAYGNMNLSFAFSRYFPSGTFSLNLIFRNLTTGGTCTASITQHYTAP
jgi:hypothetical protein